MLLELGAVASAQATDSSVGFFTNVADRLLKSHLGLSVLRIPVWPTNGFNLEAHRLLQVAANLYDANQTNRYPSVFRPVIGADPLVPGGYAVTNFACDSDVNTLSSWLTFHTQFGVPIIIGAKKGIPNFNEYVMQTTVLAARKLELRRPNTNSPPTETNQMYVLGISNMFGVEAWNSYTQACCPEEVTIMVSAVTGLTLTNDAGLYYETNWAVSAITNIPAGQWSAFEPRNLSGGFQVPLHTNIVLLTNSVYRADPPSFQQLGWSNFERGRGFPLPQWTAILSNRVAYILLAGDRILDFVLLRNLTNSVDLSGLLLNSASATPGEPFYISNCWNTNRINGLSGAMVPTEGIAQQLRVALGEEPISSTDWNSYTFGRALPPNTIEAEIDSFRSFFRLPPHRYIAENTSLVVQAPFSPARKLVQTASWQADDPLVHYMTEHLRDVTNVVSGIFIRPNLSSAFVGNNLTNVNLRYRPWGGNPTHPGHPDDFNRALKDPAMVTSDRWTFPTNVLSNVGALGRVHRGTPWQTIYLKSEIADPLAWRWHFPEPRSHPTNDWKTASILLSVLGRNDVRHLASVNQTQVALWRQQLDGITVLSNTTQSFWLPPEFVSHTMRSNSAQAQIIANGIIGTRAARQPSYFANVGDVLATPELSVASPWLNTATMDALWYGLTDEAYEKIPEQLLPRLRSEPVLGVHRMPGQTEISVETYPGHLCQVQASTDLQSWRIVAEVLAEESELVVSDTTTGGQAFYRAMILP